MAADGAVFASRQRRCTSPTDHTLGNSKPLTCCDVSAAGRFLCAGTELVQRDAYLVFWDARRPEPLGGYWESHTDEISTASHAPARSTSAFYQIHTCCLQQFHTFMYAKRVIKHTNSFSIRCC